MKPLTLTLRELPQQRLDLSALVPDKLKLLSLQQIALLPLWLGNRQYALADLFAIDGDNTGRLAFKNTCDRLDGIGAGMQSGSIHVEGDAGAYLGQGMRGGEIQVGGRCGIFAGAEMHGGRIIIDGDAGDFAGAARDGERLGMRGGLILVRGSAGARLGDRQRRGVILVEGNVGAYCASRMIAGTIGVLGNAAEYAGCNMRRGTLLLRHLPQSLPATFNDNGEHDLHFLTLLLQSFRTLDSRFAGVQPFTRVQRFVGDRACGGLGEILVWRSRNL